MSRITCDPNVMGGAPVFAGTRITVARIGGLARRGVSTDEIRKDYPNLKDADIYLAEKIVAAEGGECTDEARCYCKQHLGWCSICRTDAGCEPYHEPNYHPPRLGCLPYSALSGR